MAYKDKDKEKEWNREYYKKNKEKILKQQKEYKKEYQKEHQKEHRKQWCEYSKKWKHNNINKVKEYQKEYKRRLIVKEHRNLIEKVRRKIDLNYAINGNIRRAIKRSLRGNKNGRSWETIVGYNLNDLIKRLKKTMPLGYTWQDYLKGKLQIDHIIPVSVFNFNKPEDIDFKRCWSLTNLQLLPARDNNIKSNHLTRPFQPTLKLEI